MLERLLLLLTALALLLLTAGAALAQPAEGAGLGIRLLEAPADRADDPRAQRYIVDHVAPGEAFRRDIEVTNDRPVEGRVELYANAAEVRDGSFLPLRRGAENELTSWITVEPSAITLPPRAAARATVTVDVPPDAEPGEYYGVVFAELPGPPVTSGASISARTGIRVYLSVSRGAEPTSDFRVDSLQAVRRADGAAAVVARVTNTGGRALDLRGDLVLTEGPGGLSGGPFPAELGTTLAPGDSSPVAVPLDEAIRSGPWTAALTLRSGLLERRATAELTFPDRAGEADPVQAKNLPLREDPKILVPIAIALLGILSLLLLVTGLVTSRRRGRGRLKRTAPA